MAFIYIEIDEKAKDIKGKDKDPKFLLTKEGASWLASSATVECEGRGFVAPWAAESEVRARRGTISGYHYTCGGRVSTVRNEGAWWSVGPMGDGPRVNFGRLIDAQAAALAGILPKTGKK